MKTWQRIEPARGFSYITKLYDDGKLERSIKWNDNGEVWDKGEDNIFTMGWKSLKEFLNARPGFKLIDNNI